MEALAVIRKFETARFSVVVDALDDFDLDLSFDDSGEVRQGLESGELVAFCARARVFLDGNEIASDYLGGCIYKDVAEFQDHRQCAAENRKLRARGSSAQCGSYFSDMVSNVIAEARKNIKTMQGVKVRA